ADSIARKQLLQVDQRLLRLKALKKELKRMITDCECNRIADCKVLEVLRDHSNCLTDHEEIGA
ncbi:MAG: MerR family transcriptional regulator, partial [Rhodobacterales bacterium]